jgi:FKBP-type peptidyl-prolyl cis-trans isomerase 2
MSSNKSEKIKIQKGDVVFLHLKVSLEDGKVFDDSRSREPVLVHMGKTKIIPAFGDALMGLSEGDKKKITIEPKDGFGNYNKAAVRSIAKKEFPKDFVFEEDKMIQGKSGDGKTVRGKISKILDESIVVDYNHPLAGKISNFSIDILEIKR